MQIRILITSKLEKTVDETVLMKKLGPALEKKQKKTIEIDVSNINRSLGTIFGSEITKKYGTTLDEDTFVVKCHGSGGQSSVHLSRRTHTGTGWRQQRLYR